MKKTLLGLLIISLSYAAGAQQYFTKNGKISFFSKATLEDIKADNNQVISVLSTSTGELQFSLLNNAFHFDKALMEEHFNDDYMESATYPKSTFKGSIANMGSVNLGQDGKYNVTVTGELQVHGVTRTVSIPATLTVKGGKLSATATFSIKPADHNIKIPAAVRNNIAETLQVTVSCTYEKK